MDKFTNATILLPTIDETYLLEQTVEIIFLENNADINDIIILVCGKTKPNTLQIAQKLVNQYPERISIINQTRPFIGGAIQDGFDLAKGSHVIMMASDMETNPHDVVKLIEKAKQFPNEIITASRWLKKGEFEGYSIVKWIANFVFQKVFRILYRVSLSDLTFGYRIFPSELVKSINWEEYRHPFFLETILKPIMLGVKIYEISSSWKARTEGESQNTFMRNFEYFRIGFKTKFYTKNQILR